MKKLELEWNDLKLIRNSLEIYGEMLGNNNFKRLEEQTKKLEKQIDKYLKESYDNKI